ncbi:hypothetical protein CLAIMM_10518 [Cladophialophora immunda]|nr:hypothetical protein CLAIMM_10518 [Cladophialophora immunda]
MLPLIQSVAGGSRFHAVPFPSFTCLFCLVTSSTSQPVFSLLLPSTLDTTDRPLSILAHQAVSPRPVCRYLACAMALALLPPYHSYHPLQNPLPSPTVLLASAAMEQANKFRPSLPLSPVSSKQSRSSLKKATLPLQHSVPLEGFLGARMDME